jgi:putative colanic acid biosynthesis UDP-glucose lipid carrier transferase
MPVIAICESPFTGLNSMVKRTSDIVLALIIQVCCCRSCWSLRMAMKLPHRGR